MTSYETEKTVIMLEQGVFYRKKLAPHVNISLEWEAKNYHSGKIAAWGIISNDMIYSFRTWKYQSPESYI